MTGDALLEARDELRRRCSAAGAVGDWDRAMVLGELAGVADFVRRIADGPDALYRAVRSRDLVCAVLAVRREEYNALGVLPDDDEDRTPVEVACRLVPEDRGPRVRGLGGPHPRAPAPGADGPAGAEML